MSTGVLGDGLRLLDVDIDVSDLAQKVRELAQAMLGDTLIRHRARVHCTITPPCSPKREPASSGAWLR